MIPDQTDTATLPPTEPRSVRYTPCEKCGAPLDEQQRYCLTCGTRRKHASDPAARFLAGASRRHKPAGAVVGSSARGGGSISVLTLGAILLIPLALGLGVLVGHSSSSSPDSKLISALQADRAAGGGASGAGAASTTASGTSGSASPTLVVGNWTRSSGYAIELSSLPHSASSATAAKAEQADRSRGATAVGVLNTSAYHITPGPSGGYVIYSGSYATSAAAGKALSALKKKFPSAQVIHVVIPAATSNTKVVSRTQYGAAQNPVGYKPSAANLAQGAQVAAQDAHSKGKAASGAGLPDVVSVP